MLKDTQVIIMANTCAGFVICQVLISHIYCFLFVCFLTFWPHHVARGILVPGPGIKLMPPALEAQSLNHWTYQGSPPVAFSVLILPSLAEALGATSLYCPRVPPRACVLSRSVMSNSFQPYGLQPTRLLCPWDSPGKNTGVDCHLFLQGIF